MIVAGTFLACVVPGCIELQALLGVLPPPNRDGSGGGTGGGNGGGGSGGGDTVLPVVTLIASNVTPQLDEQVTLRCVLRSGSSNGLSYSFGSSLARLSVDQQNGTAEFIVEQADLGAGYSFTCAAANALGAGPRSNQVVVTPTDVTAP